MSFLVAPSMLAADFSDLGKEIQSIERAGANWIHWDIMDAHFVPGLSFGPSLVKKLRSLSSLPFDVHLMVSNPDSHIEDFKASGADYLTFHIESECSPLSTIQEIKRQGMNAGISLKPSTPLDSVFPFLSQVDLVLIMTVEPGKGGQNFIRSQAEKVKELKSKITCFEKPPLIEVDGGIIPESVKWVDMADVLVSGTYIFNSGNYSQAIASLKSLSKFKSS